MFFSTADQDALSLESKIGKILQDWDIQEFGLRKVSMGNSGLVWIVKTPKQKFVLRNTGKDIEYLEFQTEIIECLSKTDFPYLLPKLRQTKDLRKYLTAQNEQWILYDFIEGKPISNSSLEQASEIGILVANFHKSSQKILHNLDPDYLAGWSLPIFEKHYVNSILGNLKRVNLLNECNFFIKQYLIRSTGNLLEKYEDIVQLQRSAALELPKMLVYNDWHGNNIIQHNSKIVGIIDFDSLTVASRVLDFQNALIQFSDPLSGVLTPKGRAFIEGYFSILKFSRVEVNMSYYIMLERLTWFLAHLCENPLKKRKLDLLLIKCTALSNWLLDNQELFENFLFSAVQSSTETHDE